VEGSRWVVVGFEDDEAGVGAIGWLVNVGDHVSRREEGNVGGWVDVGMDVHNGSGRRHFEWSDRLNCTYAILLKAMFNSQTTTLRRSLTHHLLFNVIVKQNVSNPSRSSEHVFVIDRRHHAAGYCTTVSS
jgi:hypothetical protein